MVRTTLFDCGGVNLAVHGDFTDNTMVFQHGLCDTAEFPLEAFPEGTDTSVVAMDFRGHGQSDVGATEQLSIKQFTDDVINLIESRASKPVVIGGISMGSAVALRVAVKRPDLVRALVLGRPAWLMSPAPSNLLPLLLVGRSLHDDPSGSGTSFMKSEIYRLLLEHYPHNLNALLELFGRRPLDTIAALLERISLDGPGLVIEEVAAVSVPTLVVGTNNDIIHPLDYASSLSSIIPNAKLAVITPKFDDVDQYREDFRSALSSFLSTLNQ
ncbi:MAG: alpha/beta hydrolase [Pseudomonadota bacterium]